MPHSSGALSDTVTLVVEDDRFVASYVAAVIQATGGEVLGPFSSVEAALDCLSRRTEPPHAALLNARLAEDDSFSFADGLAGGSVPLIFSSDHPETCLPDRFGERPLIPKPFAAYQVVEELVALLNAAAGRGADRGAS
jgi:DNA-binding response OmpR family regulator